MDGEEIIQQEPEQQAGPTDLAEAFRMLGKEEQKPAADPVGQQPEPEPAPAPEPEVGGGEPEPDQGVGGSADGVEDFDIKPARDAILTDIQRSAYNEVAQMYKKEGIKYITIDMLYERDERTGQVSFKNPDNPNRNFESRSDAQQWCDAFNKQIDTKFKMDVREKQAELYKQAVPKLKILQFKNTYDKMDKNTRDIFEDLVEPYEIRNQAGQIVGYSCDLESMAKQANKISSRFTATSPTLDNKGDAPAPKVATKPAMDMKTGVGKRDDFVEPSNIGEALKMYDKMNRKKA